MVLWMVLVACGGEEAPLRSSPTEALTELGGEEGEQQITWSALGELFTEDSPLPGPLGQLKPDMAGTDVQAIFDAARPPGTSVNTVEVPGHVVVSAGLADYPMVTMSLLLEDQGRTLRAVDIALPYDQALAELGARWGDPDETTTSEASGNMKYVWQHEGTPWVAELHDIGEGKAVLKVRPRS